MAKPRFPGKPHRLLSRNRTRISTVSAQHDDDTVDIVGNICLGLAIFKHNFGDSEEPYIPGKNEFKGFNRREVSESKARAKRKLKEAERCDISILTCPTAPLYPKPPSLSEASNSIVLKEEKNDDFKETDGEVIGIPSSKRARRKGGGRKSLPSLVPKQESLPEVAEVINEEPAIMEEPKVEPVKSVSMLPEAEIPTSIVGHPLIVEGKRRWKPTYKVLQGPSSLEEARRLGGEAWPFGARPINRAVEAPAPIGGKFVTGGAEKDQNGKSSWKLGSTSSGVRPSGGGILREARLRLDSAASGSEDGEWVRRMMDGTEKSKKLSVVGTPKPLAQSPVQDSGSGDKNAPDGETSPARVYCRICKGAMSRRFSKRKTGKRGVWSCKACREFVTEMNKKLRSEKGVEGNLEKESVSENVLICHGGKDKCIEEEGWPQAPPQRCVPCWLRLCLNAPPPHLIPCPVSRAALRKLIPQHTSQLTKEPLKRGKKRKAHKELQSKGKRQKVTAEGPRVKHVCRSAMAVLGRPPATFPAREPLQTHGGEAANVQETETSGEVKAAEGSAEKQPDSSEEQKDVTDSSTVPEMTTVGAHQWWKQRKGMHRRRKRGRLSLALPRQHGRPALQHNAVHKLHSVAKSGATPAKPSQPVAELGPPIQLTGFPFRPDVAEVFTNGFGVVQVAPNIMPVQPLCFLCGSGGKKWIVHCALCCEPFHTFCVEWAGWDIFDGWDIPIKGPSKLSDGEKLPPLDWMCRRCSLCHACGLPAYVPGGGVVSVTSKGSKNKENSTNEKKDKAEDEGSDTKKKKKEADSSNGTANEDENEVVEDMGTRTCNICHRCYHGVCLGSNGTKNGDLDSFIDKDKPWVCSTCLRCHSCGKPSVVGSVHRNDHLEGKEIELDDFELKGPEDILMCASCLALHRKRNFCPLCHVVYRDTDFDASMMQCAQCTYWVHANCEGLSDDQYHLLSLLPSSVEFTCSPCTKETCPPWKKAMDKKLRQGFEKILEALDAAAQSRRVSAISSYHSMNIPIVNPSNRCESSSSVNYSHAEHEKLPDIFNQSQQKDVDSSIKDVLKENSSKKSNRASFSPNQVACGSGNSNIKENNISPNGDKRKVSFATDKIMAPLSGNSRDALLFLKERVNRGDFGALYDFYVAVEKLFFDNDRVLSALNSTLVKVFPWVKPKSCTRDVKKKLDVLLSDHCYTSVGRNNDIVQWIPKTPTEEKDNLKVIDSDSISLKPTLPTCDLLSSDEVLHRQFGSCSESSSSKKCSHSKEQSNQNENLWMDPSDYIPNHKVYSFASALRRRSLNRKSLCLSTKLSQPKSEPSNSPSEQDNTMTLENSKNIVTYTSGLAGRNKESLGSDINSDDSDKIDNNHIKLEDAVNADENPIKEAISCSEESPNLSHKAEDQCSTFSEGKDTLASIPKENTLKDDCSKTTDFLGSEKDNYKKTECSSNAITISPTSNGCSESHPRADGRRCLFCHVKGDADVDREGRLLLASSFGDWVHCNCALWSAEVFEEKGGLLMKVREAVNRGRRVRCALCQDTGATLGCCLRGCPDSYHLGCALRSGCLLLEDKSVYCRNHIPSNHKDGSVELYLKRPVQVDTEGRHGSVLWRWRKPGRGKRKPGEDPLTFPAGSLRFTVGSLHVDNLGKIIPGNIQGHFLRPPEVKDKIRLEDEMRWCEGGVSLAKKDDEEANVSEMLISGGSPVIVPVGLTCTRLYWSSVEPWKIVEYRIQTMLVVSEVEETDSPSSEEREEMSNEEEDLQVHVTVDHSAEVEDSNHNNDDEETPDLMVPFDISDEIIKEISPEIFSNKKLMQSILFGLIKGTSNGESQNGGMHPFEADDEGNKLKGLKDSECPASSPPSNQAVKVPRHSKPVNVVQPVTKETLLSTESASPAWELTCEMRPAQTPPPSASPVMSGAAGNAPESSTTVVPVSKPAIWSEDPKKSWKHARPIPQLDGNADPSSSSSEGGGSSPVRTSPSREATQPIPCLLACRIKQQSLAHSEPGGGGPVKCNECRRTYRTQEGYERHLCETPLLLSSTSSDSDSEDRTSRRVSSESDVATLVEECYNEYPEKEKAAALNDDGLTADKVEALQSAYSSNNVPDEDNKSNNEPESFSDTVHSLNAEQTSISSINISGSLISPTNKSHLGNNFGTISLCHDISHGEQCDNLDNSLASKEPKQVCNQVEDPQVTCTNNTEYKPLISSSESLSLNCDSPFYSENLPHTAGRVTTNPSSQTVVQKEVKEGVWRGLASDSCPSRSTKRQTAMVQPLCYVNGKRRIPSGDSPNIAKVSRFNLPQDDSFLCSTQQQVPQRAIAQAPLVSASLAPSVNNNFQVLVRQLSSASAVPQFAENFRQQTGHTLQYLATIDSGSFSQQAGMPQAQGLVGLIQSSPQLMQTQTLMPSPQVMAPSSIVLAPQQPTLVYNPVTACLEALPAQQQSFILTPQSPAYTIPVSSSLQYSMSEEIPQVYFQTAPVPHPHPPPTMPAPAPPPAQLEPIIQTESGWSLAPGYQIVQNPPIEQPQTLLIPTPQVAPPTVAPVNVPVQLPPPEVAPAETPPPPSPKVPISNVQRPSKRKRLLLPNLPSSLLPNIPSQREGVRAYRRDEKTGKYIPLDEGWVDSLMESNQKGQAMSEELCARTGLLPSAFTPDVKDASGKDILGAIRRKSVSKISDGETSSGLADETVKKLDNLVNYARVAPPSGCWRSPSKDSFVHKQTFGMGGNCPSMRVNSVNKSSKEVMHGAGKTIKRVESTSVMYQVHSADGISIESDTPDKIWDQVFNSVQKARIAHGLAPLPRNPFAPMSGSKPFMGAETLALSHKGLRYLLNQLPGASQLLESDSGVKEPASTVLPPHRLFSRAHLSLSTQTPVPETPVVPPRPCSPPLPENPSGCARSEPFKCPPPPPNPMVPGELCPSLKNRKWQHRDIFGWLASPHRKLPSAPLPTQENEANGGGNSRRATSLDLPMAMRFRHLKETSRETVGVYRSHIHGRGLFCLKDIEAGEMVIEYSGEVIRSSLTDTREKTYEAKGMGCYMFRIDEQTVVDATMRGNAARFINHSCDPNCYSRVVDILGKKHILIFALRRIPRGEELTYDYKFPFEDVKIPCHCASKRCRKYLN